MKKQQTNVSLICAIMKFSVLQTLLAALFSGMVIASPEASFGQSVLDEVISINAENQKMKNVLSDIERSIKVKFTYNPQVIPVHEKITLDLKNEKLSEILDRLFMPLGVVYEVSGKYIILSMPVKRSSLEDVNTRVESVVSISGTVTEEEGSPLPGVNVFVKGTTEGTTTDAEGKYTLNVTDPKGILVFSFIGYATQEIPINNQSVINVVLQADITALEEIVVIGYGTQNKQDLTSSVASVKAEDFNKGNVMDAAQLIQGKVAGLTISVPSGDPTSGSQILLRGNTTLLGANSNPLVLIDGVPGDFRTVAPEDIESIDVLKDGSAAAIYGTRGTNGVIIITTRRARGGEASRVEYSANFSTQSIARQLELFTADDYRAQIAAGTREADWDLGASTDWMEEITQSPFSQVHNLTFSGGNHKTNYLANVNYRDLEGIFKRSDNKTFTGRVDINHSMFDDKLKFNFGFLNSSNKYGTTGDGVSFNGYTYRQALIRNPTSPVKDADGNWFEQTGLFNYENPLARLHESDGENSAQNTRLNSTVTYTPVPDLKLMALFSHNKYNQARGYAETKNHISTLRDGRNGFASSGSVESIDRLMELTANYTKAFNDHNLGVLAGYSYQDNSRREFWMQNWDFPTDRFDYHNMGLGNAIKDGLAPISSNKVKTNLIGFFGRATYSFRDKYLLLASLRHEAASQLYGTDSPWGTFPAVSVGWRMSSEPFIANTGLFDNLKLRAGYGVTGTQPSDLFLGVAMLNYEDYYYYDNKWIRTLVPVQNPNPNLRWEEKHETNIGLDFSMFNDRVSGNIDYYIRNIDGLLYDYAVPYPPNLYPSTRANVGKMQNKGLEVLINVIPTRTKDFEWMSSVNFSTNSNKLISLSNDLYKTTNDYFTTGATGEPIQTFTHIVRVGKNIGDFYGFKVVDIDEDGKWIYAGKNGETIPYDDFDHAFEHKQVLGNGLPKYYAGWNNNFRYKNFDLGITMRGAFGYQILNFQRMYFENPTLPQYNQLKTADDKVFGKAVLDAPLEFNSYYIEDGDHWKIDNVTLGYTVNTAGSKYFRSARVYVSTLNTFTITGYKGIDPEVNRLGLSPGNDGRDKYPTTRTYTIGFNVSF